MNTSFVLAAFCLISCQPIDSSSNAYQVPKVQVAKPKRSITKVTVRAVNFDITTYGATSCDKFNQVFDDAPKKEITNLGVLTSLSHKIDLFQVDTIHFVMDARAQATIYYNDSSTSSLCISRFVMEFNGNRVKYNQSINDLLGIATKPGEYR